MTGSKRIPANTKNQPEYVVHGSRGIIPLAAGGKKGCRGKAPPARGEINSKRTVPLKSMHGRKRGICEELEMCKRDRP